MELRHLRYFLAVAEELNFRRAAEKLGIAQPPLSSQIRDLENEIGVPLFRRVPKGAELTEAGVALLSAVPTVFDKLDEAIKLAQRGGRGEVGQLRVGYTGSASFNQIVPQSLRVFRRAYPDVALILEELPSPRLLDQLGRQRLDAAFIRPGNTPPQGFTITPLGEEPLMVAVPSGHRLAARDAVDLAELKDEPFILFSRAYSPDIYDEIIESCRRVGFDPTVAQIASQIISIANLVAVELGVSIMPAQFSNVNIPGVVFRRIAGSVPVARLALATRLDDRSVVTRNFCALARKIARLAPVIGQ